VTRLHQALVRALQSNEVRTRLAAFGDTVTSKPAELQTNRQLILSGRVKLN